MSYAKKRRVDSCIGCSPSKIIEPFVVKNAIIDWPAAVWTVSSLGNSTDSELTFRMGALDRNIHLWESECNYRSGTVKDFQTWMDNTDVQGPVTKCDTNGSKQWYYCDYKHMRDVFSEYPDMIKSVDWTRFGYPARNGDQSTFWMGSSGAYTNCHQDCYGFNLVAQIYGRKLWILFPPSDMPNMYPTRVPYEESSIFSAVDVRRPNLCRHPRFKSTHPHVVVLEPGDVLYVPKHWWHYVECLDTSISINTWVEVDSDKHDRVTEAITRTLMSSVVSNTGREDWINPTEDIYDSQTNLLLLAMVLKSATIDDAVADSVQSGNSEPTASAVQKSVANTAPCCNCDLTTDEHYESIPVKECTFDTYLQHVHFDVSAQVGCQENSGSGDSASTSKTNLTLQTFVNCFLHPSVTDLVSRILDQS